MSKTRRMIDIEYVKWVKHETSTNQDSSKDTRNTGGREFAN